MFIVRINLKYCVTGNDLHTRNMLSQNLNEVSRSLCPLGTHSPEREINICSWLSLSPGYATVFGALPLFWLGRRREI